MGFMAETALTVMQNLQLAGSIAILRVRIPLSPPRFLQAQAARQKRDNLLDRVITQRAEAAVVRNPACGLYRSVLTATHRSLDLWSGRDTARPPCHHKLDNFLLPYFGAMPVKSRVLEYAPEPPFQSGILKTAPREILEATLAQGAQINSARTATAHRIGKRLDIAH